MKIWFRKNDSKMVCPNCSASARAKSVNYIEGLVVVSFGFYRHVRYRNIGYTCSRCIPEVVKELLQEKEVSELVNVPDFYKEDSQIL